MKTFLFLVLAISACYAQSLGTYTVYGYMNPWLAAAPNGSTCCSGPYASTPLDSAPAESPLMVTGFQPGDFLTFSVTGQMSYSGGTPTAPTDGTQWTYTGPGSFQIGYNYFGMGTSGNFNITLSRYYGPYNTLLGVFLAGDPPAQPASQPAGLDFTTSAPGTGFSYLSPAIGQVFFIGDGLTGSGSGTPQRFKVPVGATALYLGGADGYAYAGDTGSFTVAISQSSPVNAVLRDTYGSIQLSPYASPTLSNSGGLFGSDPSAAQDSSGNTFVTAEDDFGSIWANVYKPGTSAWSGWQFGGGIIQGVPAIAVDKSGTGWIASRDTYNSYWLVSYTTGSGFGAWIPLEGIFSTDPVVTACGDGSIYLIGKDTWNSLWSAQYLTAGGGFQGWVFGGGIITGKPAATCGSDNAVYVVGEDSWNSNWMVRVSGNTWGTWYFGGAITSITPRIAALGNGSEAIVILDSTGVVYGTTYTEGTANGWQPWAEIGGILSDVAPAGAGGELYLAGKAPNGDLWWWQQTGDQWTWIGNNGVAAGALAASPK